MLEGRDLIIFGSDWDWFPSVMKHIALHLAPNNRILWVGSVSIRKPRLRVYDVRRVVSRIGKMLSGNRPPIAGSSPVVELHPFIIPFYDVPAVRRANDFMLRNSLRRRIRELGFRDIISFPSTPIVAGIVGTLGETSSHYFCVDDYRQYEGAYRSVKRLEEEILGKVDSCFTVSEPLLKTRQVKSAENHFLPMGVDTGHFSPSQDAPPPEIASIGKPIAGFIGLLGSYVDVDLIVRCAKAYPNISVVVIGRSMVDLSLFMQAPNITYLGEIPYERLPRYSQMFDVGLNPRIVNELTLAMNPLKIVEYLSMGMPVVSTDTPAVRDFKDSVYIAETRDRFVELVGAALQDTDPEKKKARRAVAGQYSWSAISRRVAEIVDRIDGTKRLASLMGQEPPAQVSQ